MIRATVMNSTEATYVPVCYFRAHAVVLITLNMFKLVLIFFMSTYYIGFLIWIYGVLCGLYAILLLKHRTIHYYNSAFLLHLVGIFLLIIFDVILGLASYRLYETKSDKWIFTTNMLNSVAMILLNTVFCMVLIKYRRALTITPSASTSSHFVQRNNNTANSQQGNTSVVIGSSLAYHPPYIFHQQQYPVDMRPSTQNLPPPPAYNTLDFININSININGGTNQDSKY